MNRKLIGAVAFTAVVAGGYLAHNIQKQSDEQLSDLMIENIEALADDEGSYNEVNPDKEPEQDPLSGSPCYNKGNYDIEYPESVALLQTTS